MVRMVMTAKVEMIGKTFGRLTVTDEAPPRVNKIGRKRPRYFCLCSCGKQVEASKEGLQSGRATSCGCAHRDRMRSRAKDLTGFRFGRLTVVEEVERGAP